MTHLPQRLGLALLVAFAASACSETPALADRPGVSGAIESVVEYATFTELAEETGLLDELETGGPYTVLVPTDIAFVYVGADVRPVLTDPAQRDVLRRILRHHVVPGRLGPDDFTDGTVLTSLDEEPLRVRRVGPIVTVENATIDIREPIDTENGSVYPASNVIRTNLTTRERIELSPTLSTFARFALETGLLDEADRLGDRTILVPIDGAFTAIQPTTTLLDQDANADVLAKVVRPHVLPGRVDLEALPDGAEVQTLGGQTITVTPGTPGPRVDGVPVLGRPYDTADGRIYLVGGVLFKGLTLAERLRVLPEVTRFPVETREVGDVWARLQDPNDELTVFAPRDAVYQTQNPNVRLALSQPENATLLGRTRRVLIVEGRYTPRDLQDGTFLTALDGSRLEVRVSGEDVFVGGRRVTLSGATVANGVLYTTDGFINPKVDPFDTAILSGMTAFARTIRNIGLESTVRNDSLTIFVPSNLVFQQVPTLFSNPDLRDILLYQMSPERLPFSPDISPPVQPFPVLTGEDRAFARKLDPESNRYVGPILIDGKVEIPLGIDTFDGRSRLFFNDIIVFRGALLPEPGGL